MQTMHSGGGCTLSLTSAQPRFFWWKFLFYVTVSVRLPAAEIQVNLLCTGGGEVGGGVVLNELLICVQY